MPKSFAAALESPNFWRILVVTVLVGYAFTVFLSSISSILSPFIAGFIGAYIFSGLVQKLENYKIPRVVAALLIIVTLLVVLIVLGMVAVPFLQKELIILSKNLPSLASRAYEILERVFHSLNSAKIGDLDLRSLNLELNQSISFLAQWVIHFAVNIIGNGTAFANIVTFILLSPLVMFYFLKDWPRFIASLNQLLPESSAESARTVVVKIHKTLASYGHGQVILCAILMVLYSIGLSLVGLRQAIFIGMLTGCLAFIPYVGMLVGLLASLAVAFEQFQDWSSILMVGGIYATIHLIESNFLTPYLIGDRVGLHPIWILFALLAGGLWFGFVGILLAIPVAAAVGVLVRSIFTPSTPKS
ncbi:AI-2E family transporter [Candidatus Finniella inopinata]|uniref:AI-2E family transporter n=1 Tax=Candidatus Finniella inopinata TaxID=1696036 RepID=A0A4V2DZY5_9PROT|nr:AI-2E family transporter [Candidatus Finniella inopinata]RZI46677.1 AI-2E family transporter [Candidatus Finniella inopinata]